jgi:hypothetical protein
MFVLIIGSEVFLNRNYVNVLFMKKYFYYFAFGLLIISLIIKKERKNL